MEIDRELLKGSISLLLLNLLSRGEMYGYEILQAAGGKRIRWAPFCAKAVALGLVDTRGQAPTERNARETWAQARRAVQEARGRPAGSRSCWLPWGGSGSERPPC